MKNIKETIIKRLNTDFKGFKSDFINNETDKKYILALDLLDLLNTHHEENIKIKSLIDEKIDYLQRKYDFGQEQGFCPMHNIMHSINVLKEIKKEMGWE